MNIIARYQQKRKARPNPVYIDPVREYWLDFEADARACGLFPRPVPCPVPVPSGGGRPPKKRGGGR